MAKVAERSAHERETLPPGRTDAEKDGNLFMRRLAGYARCSDLFISVEGKRPEEVAAKIWAEVRGAFDDRPAARN